MIQLISQVFAACKLVHSVFYNQFFIFILSTVRMVLSVLEQSTVSSFLAYDYCLCSFILRMIQVTKYAILILDFLIFRMKSFIKTCI